MIQEIRVPAIAETINQVQLASWLVEDGEMVDKDQEIAEIDSDKATLAISASEGGKIRIVAQLGETLEIGAVMCEIDTAADGPKKLKAADEKSPDTTASMSGKVESIPAKPVIESSSSPIQEAVSSGMRISPLARKLMDEASLNESELVDLLKGLRVNRKDIAEIVQMRDQSFSASLSQKKFREVERKKMTTLRIKLAERLVSVKNQTAMLTTFNEVNMSAVLGLKAKHVEKFKEKFGTSFGLMSFFSKAVSIALKEFPMVNAQIDGDELIIPDYVDMGIAVSAPKGLVVPVIRNIENLSIAEIEKSIKELATKARNNKISIEEMTGGTFTITNGGVFGSMMSTPILNPPQSAILGMHNIIERPVAINGQVVIQPMMYVALSYDHRVIDGRESVGFLVRVKEMLENPSRMLFNGKDPDTVLLGL